MQIWFNDEPLACADNLSVSALLTQLEQQQLGVALALNQHILPRDRWEDHLCRKAIGSCFFRLSLEADMLRIADKTFESHLSPVPANSPPGGDGRGDSRLGQPAGNPGDEARRFTPAQ